VSNVLITAAVSLAEGAARPGISDPSFWLRIFEISPAIVALLAVIYWLYRLIVAKDKTMYDLVRAGQGDIERQSRLIALLEMALQGGIKRR
jgi:hypothetical protein